MIYPRENYPENFALIASGTNYYRKHGESRYLTILKPSVDNRM